MLLVPGSRPPSSLLCGLLQIILFEPDSSVAHDSFTQMSCEAAISNSQKCFSAQRHFLARAVLKWEAFGVMKVYGQTFSVLLQAMVLRIAEGSLVALESRGILKAAVTFLQCRGKAEEMHYCISYSAI